MSRHEPMHEVEIRYEDIRALPSPAYDVWDWDRYWSPEPIVLYSPTRGCYWNKCTFCDYGLNSDRPTSPSRERPLAAVAADLAVAARHGRVLYFAVDAMSPRYLRGLASAMADSPFEFKWSAELRLERTFPQRSVGASLAASGCVAVSFGYESASQRILDLIDKGVRIDNVPGVLAELARNGIAAQLMGFTDFPTETAAEARATFEFLRRHDALWTTAGVGEFQLTPGSIVAKQPWRFGVEVLPGPVCDDVRRWVPWLDVESGTEHWFEGEDPRVPEEYREWIDGPAYPRPFVGGIDSAHSLLYFARYGPGLLPQAEPGEAARTRLISERVVPVPFAALGELASVDELLEEAMRRSRARRDTTAASYGPWLRESGHGRPGSSSVLLHAHGRPVELSQPADLSPAGR
jgi:anaerobic magnesium-protoporphyrin IX monomethyl ester cyclase